MADQEHNNDAVDNDDASLSSRSRDSTSRLRAFANRVRDRLPSTPPLRLANALRGAARGAVSVVLPPRCASCGDLVGSDGALCPTCWREIRFITAPVCARCGFPFDYDHGPEMICADCAGDEPPFRIARAAAVYDEASRALVLAFKHGDRTDLAPLFAGWLSRAGGEALTQADLIVPVPLHWSRLLRRKYNQSALIGRLLAKRFPARFAPQVLERRKATPPLGSLSAAARRERLKGAFALREKDRALVTGARVVLIDDVYTTGATSRACCRVLNRAGAAHVDVLVATRTVRTMP